MRLGSLLTGSSSGFATAILGEIGHHLHPCRRHPIKQHLPPFARTGRLSPRGALRPAPDWPSHSASCSAPSPKPPAPVHALLTRLSSVLSRSSGSGRAYRRDRAGLSLWCSRHTRGQGLSCAQCLASHCRTGRVGINYAGLGSGPAAEPVIRQPACRGCAACGRGGSAWPAGGCPGRSPCRRPWPGRSRRRRRS